MSSTSKIENVGFKYIWKIENFSKCAVEKGECLTSPRFVVENLSKSSWYLSLYPRGFENENEDLECYLFREPVDCGPPYLKIKYYISLITTDKTDQGQCTEKEKFQNGDASLYPYSRLRTEIFENRSVFAERHFEYFMFSSETH